MANLFNSVKIRPPKRNAFNLSHDVKLTMKPGALTPFVCVDCLPGDVYKGNTEVLARFAPMLAPVMHKVNLYTHFFFVPKRLLWDNFKEFVTGGEDGMSSPAYPRFTLDSQTLGFLFRDGSLADYLGFPTVNMNASSSSYSPQTINQIGIDALPFRAYQLIWNEYYRDQNLQDEIDIQKDVDGLINITGSSPSSIKDLLSLRGRCWKKDYFTSALPFAQRGDEVELPLQGTAELAYGSYSTLLRGPAIDSVTAIGNGLVPPTPNSDLKSGSVYSSAGRSADNIKNGSDSTPVAFIQSAFRNNDQGLTTDIGVELNTDTLKKLINGVDLSTASSATINELRRAIKAQEFLEVAARGGSRYIEQIYSYFGVRSSDARLQRPEFLGGGKSPVVISDVLQTSQTTESSPQASPAGHGVSVQRSHTFKYRCEEHGYIIGIISVMPIAAYQQGLPRMYQKFDRLDLYWPQFAHLGEQEIKNSELYVPYNSDEQSKSNPDGTFGYTPRYAEYKFMNDSVHGDFKNNLNFWHMGRIFANQPSLNSAFLTNVKDCFNRVFAVQDSDVDKIWVNIHNNLKALRLMPKFGTPRL